MSYKVNEADGVWFVSKESANIKLRGEPISYSEYKELKDHPRKAADKFERKNGKLKRRELLKDSEDK